MQETELQQDCEAYRQLLDLWVKENAIKTSKLQMLLAVNGLLLAVVSLNGGFVAMNWPIYLGGAILSLVWTLSVGRTCLFQKIWQTKIKALATKYPQDSRFQVHVTRDAVQSVSRFLQVLGGVPSRYYLIGTPALFGLGWLSLLIYTVL